MTLEAAQFVNCDFSEVDFSNSEFIGINLKSVWASKCNFSHSNFASINFEYADLSVIYIEYSDFSNADFTETTFFDVNFKKGHLKNSNFDNLCLNRATFAYSNMNELYLKDNSTKNIQCHKIKLGLIDTIESSGLPVITCLLEKNNFSKTQVPIQYWPKLNIITENAFSGTLEEFEDHFINKVVINNKDDENMKKKHQAALTYIKAMAELE